MKFRAFITVVTATLALSLHTAAAQTACADDALLDAVNLMNTDRADSAFTVLTGLESLYPGNDAVHYHLSNCYRLRRDAANAIRHMRKALELSPENDHYKYSLANLYYSLGDNANAAKLYTELLRDYPSRYSDEYAWVLIGDDHLLAGRDSLALDCYSKALIYNPAYTPAILGKAETFRLQRNLPAFFSVMLPYCEDSNEEPLFKCGYVTEFLKKADASIFRMWHPQMDSMVSSCAKAHPSDSSALNLAIEWYVATGRDDLAAGYIGTMLEVFPDNVSVRFLLVQMLLERKDYGNAIAVCREILSLEGITPQERVTCLSVMGDCFHSLGKPKDCVRCFNMALDINPDYAPVLNNYAYYLSLEGKRLAKAEKMSRRALLSDPDSCTFLDTLGWILYLRKDYDEAQQCFKKAISHGGSERTEILLHYAALLYAVGDTVRADNYKWKAEHKR